MSPAPLLAFLGATFLLPGVQALSCNRGALEGVRNASELPLEWTTSTETCEIGKGCQETLVLIRNGPQISLILTKGCTEEKDQEPRITEHRAGPGLSIISYTRVCRHRDFCNDLSDTEPLGGPPSATVPGTLKCPVCLSKDVCSENAPQQICPAGSTHCYDGVLRLRGGRIITNLRVQGCMPQPGCNLLNGTQTIGPIDVSEKCASRSGLQTLDCQWGFIETVRNISELPLRWTATDTTCERGEGCRETLMLVKNGPQVSIILTKGCTEEEDHEARITEHRAGPGLSIISYSQVCRHRDFCNDLSTTAPLGGPPSATVPGTLLCPLCSSKDGCPENPPQQICPAGYTHCYNGVLKLRGEGIATILSVQGCLPQPGCNLLNGTQKIGSMDVSENCNPKSDVQPLECKRGALETIRDVSTLPLYWTTGWEICAIGEGCQETVVLIVNGAQVDVVLTKGCTKAEDQEPRVTWHRTGPGLSVVSYTHVCRHRDFCNDLSTTETFWTMPPSTGARVPGTLLCPLCLSKDDCPENPPQQICPAGYTHCYNGVVRLREERLATNLRVQGCLPQSGCNLLNGTQIVGSVNLSEDCESKTGIVTCHRGSMLKIKRNLAEEPVEWEANSQQVCNPGEVCQETLLLIDPAPGQKSLLLGSKGCSYPSTQSAPAVSTYSNFPGILVASYAQFCSSNLCNTASDTSVLLSSLSRPAAPVLGELQCPVCVQFGGSCAHDSTQITCPNETTHCYKGDIDTRGGGISATFSIQGCMPESSRSLLKNVQKIGIFSVKEYIGEKTKDTIVITHSGAHAPYLAWIVYLGPFIALWYGGFLLYAKSIFP
ncbi:CD177 antigen [Octodon degus]|uniref:CD177 antigen n=1 Tax=Octodon degus TaxID=10160 RepID=A0A6P6DK22_OCTDE|nr:CD177 antigen [Octodon degus]